MEMQTEARYFRTSGNAASRQIAIPSTQSRFDSSDFAPRADATRAGEHARQRFRSADSSVTIIGHSAANEATRSQPARAIGPDRVLWRTAAPWIRSRARRPYYARFSD